MSPSSLVCAVLTQPTLAWEGDLPQSTPSKHQGWLHAV